MKKLSLILAFILVLTCSVFVACTEETETSSEAAAESSAAESATESEAVSEAVSEVESEVESETEDASSEAPAVETGANLALGKTYTTSELFRQGGAPDYNYDPNAEIAYPDTDGTEMTDGVISDIADWDTFWEKNAAIIGFHATEPSYAANGNYACITLDLGEACDLAKFVTHVVNPEATSQVTKVAVAVSADGETWTEAGSADVTSLGAVAVEIALSETVNAQYVQYRITGSAYWMFVSEVEAYAPAE